MKKLLLIFALLATVACSKTEEGTPAMQKERISAYAEQIGSRVELDGLQMKWEVGDIVNIFNSEGKSFSMTVTELTESGAKLEGEVVSRYLKSKDQYTAVHGSLAGTAFIEMSKINFEIPENQNGKFSNAITLYDVSQADADYHNLNFRFSTVNSVFRFTIPEEAGKVSELVFRGLDNENITGTYSYDGNTIVNNLNGKEIIVENPAGNEIVISVPCGATFKKGYSVSYVTEKGSSISAYKLSGFEAGKVYEKELLFTPFSSSLSVSSKWSDFKSRTTSTLEGNEIAASGTWYSAQNSVISKAEIDCDGERFDITDQKEFSSTISNRNPGSHTLKVVITDIYGNEYPGEEKTIIVLDPDAISVSMDSPKSSYSYYKGENGAAKDIVKANNMGGKYIEKGSATIEGCPEEFVSECGYYFNGLPLKATRSITFTIGTDGDTALGTYSYKAYAKIDGVKFVSHQSNVSVTGIPFSYSFTNKNTSTVDKDGWVRKGNTGYQTSQLYLAQGNSTNDDGCVFSPEIYVPANITTYMTIHGYYYRLFTSGTGKIGLDATTQNSTKPASPDYKNIDSGVDTSRDAGSDRIWTNKAVPMGSKYICISGSRSSASIVSYVYIHSLRVTYQ